MGYREQNMHRIWFKAIMEDDTVAYMKGFEFKDALKRYNIKRKTKNQPILQVKSHSEANYLPREVKDVKHKWSTDNMPTTLPSDSEFYIECKKAIIDEGKTEFNITAGHTQWRLALHKETPFEFIVMDRE